MKLRKAYALGFGERSDSLSRFSKKISTKLDFGSVFSLRYTNAKVSKSRVSIGNNIKKISTSSRISIELYNVLLRRLFELIADGFRYSLQSGLLIFTRRQRTRSYSD